MTEMHRLKVNLPQIFLTCAQDMRTPAINIAFQQVLICLQRVAERGKLLQDTVIMEEMQVLGLLDGDTPIKGTPMLNDVQWLTNASLDDSQDWQKIIGKAGLPFDGEQPYPLTTREQDFIGEGGMAIPGVPNCDLILGHSGVLRGKKVFLPCVEFHFRNDATRHVWGTPVTLETNLPDRETMLNAAMAMLARIRPKLQALGGECELELDQYEQTKDRHILWFALPCDWVAGNFKAYADWSGFLKGFCS